MSEQTRPAPYPADTRAKGWRFEIDYEKVEQSDTWDLAAEVPMAQHSLLMMWLVSWRQEPCGSLPNDEAVIRSKCKIPAKLWPALRPILLRGWWVAEDGRMYHDTITARVMEMLEYRRKTAERVSKFKLAQREQHASNALADGYQQVKNDTGTNLKEEEKEKGARKRGSPLQCPEGVDLQTWNDWLQLRKAKKAPVTATVIRGATEEARKAGLTLEAFLCIWCRRGSQGLEASWLKPDEIQHQAKSFRQQDEASARAKAAAWTGGLLGNPSNDDFIDMEHSHERITSS